MGCSSFHRTIIHLSHMDSKALELNLAIDAAAVRPSECTTPDHYERPCSRPRSDLCRDRQRSCIGRRMINPAMLKLLCTNSRIGLYFKGTRAASTSVSRNTGVKLELRGVLLGAPARDAESGRRHKGLGNWRMRTVAHSSCRMLVSSDLGVFSKIGIG